MIASRFIWLNNLRLRLDVLKNSFVTRTTMTELLSPAAQAVLSAANASATNAWSDATHQRFRSGVAAALRAVVEQLGYSNVPEEFTHLRPLVIDSDDLLAIAAELEGGND
jgi:hypothetical protein